MGKNISVGHSRNHLIGIILVVLGFFFFLGLVFQFDPRNLLQMNTTWPALLVVPGAFLVLVGVLIGQSGNVITIIGGVMTAIGLIFLVQVATGLWLTWSYAWALAVPAAIGIASITQGIFTSQAHLIFVGLRALAVGLSIFVVCFVVFELLLGVSGIEFLNTPIFRILIPVGLIWLSGYLMLAMIEGAEEAPKDEPV